VNARGRNDPLEVLCSGPRHGQSRRKLLVWLVGVACGRDRSGRGQAGEQRRRRQQRQLLKDGVLSRRHDTGRHVGDGKNTYRWEHAICASSQDYWAGPPIWLRQELPISNGSRRRPKRAAGGRWGFDRRVIGTPESAKHLHGTLVRGRARWISSE
jgi:hypothetical protein